MGLYLVTGVAGFIGAAVADKLLEEGHKVVGIDNLSTGYLNHVPKNVDFYEMGLEKLEVLDILNQYKFDAIFHIAGQSGGELSYADPVYDLQANAQSTLILLKYAVESKCMKFIYASTVSVYGEPTNPISINESTVTSPKSFYGVGKLASENYMRIYSEQFDIDTVSLRLFNVYGPGQNLDNMKQGITSIYLSQAIRSKHIHIKGDKNRFRDIVYIDDVVNAFRTFLDKSYTGYNYYNICTGEKTLVKDLVDEIKSILPFDITTNYEGSTPGDVFGYTGCPNKIMAETSWKPTVKLDDGLKKMVKWALNAESNKNR